MNTRARLLAAVAILIVPLVLGACSSPSTTSTGVSASADAVQAASHLDVTAFSALASAQGTVLLDVRTPEEFAAGHLQGARNIDFRAPDFDSTIAQLDHTATYAVYCHSGNRSGQALQKMTTAGFTHISDLAGGISAWAQASRPVTTS